ncbi:MlaD family protein [Rhodopirellula sp. MGV]|uniref:MlaD family protein n=1 Tax=Rhodopirellula sp. MGV TaxID=2023130 RepID=UPI000B970A5F|nr:MlaD family protein [Rhodopirellula sp. MGV]OYP34087.1 hypothetical protein CGZ80_16300 [Rhodopirellula sp. MGV]PNY38019.1 MCE family protein [Rhodopirellula baltica]
MDDNRLKFGVGVLVIAAIGIGVILTFLFGAIPRVFTQEFELNVLFPNADGISSNTKVLLRGVEIGRVLEKKLQDEDVLVRIAIESAYQDKLTHEYLPRIVTGSVITRDAKLEFYKADEEDLKVAWQQQLPLVRNQRYTDAQYISNGIKKSDPFDLIANLEEELTVTLQSVSQASDSIRQVGDNVNSVVKQMTESENGEALSLQARDTLIAFQEAMNSVKKMLDENDLNETVKDIRSLVNETKDAAASAKVVMDEFQGVGVVAEKTIRNIDATVDTVRVSAESAQRSFASAEKVVQNIETITDPIAENSDEIVRQAMTSLRNLDQTLKEVQQFSRALNNSNGTVRKLIADDEMYWNLKRTLENVEMATAKLRPIMDDVRIFSDKIARDPRELGVRGALNNRPSGFGLK